MSPTGSPRGLSGWLLLTHSPSVLNATGLPSDFPGPVYLTFRGSETSPTASELVLWDGLESAAMGRLIGNRNEQIETAALVHIGASSPEKCSASATTRVCSGAGCRMFAAMSISSGVASTTLRAAEGSSSVAPSSRVGYRSPTQAMLAW